GTGVWSAAAGVSVLKSLDPLVVFGSVNYFMNRAQGFDDIDESLGDQPGRVDLGDSLQYGAGVAFALNERSSLSASFTQRFVQHTRLRPTGLDWQKVIGSHANVAMMNFGATFSLAPNVSLLASVGIGMTADPPARVAGWRLPFRFGARGGRPRSERPWRCPRSDAGFVVADATALLLCAVLDADLSQFDRLPDEMRPVASAKFAAVIVEMPLDCSGRQRQVLGDFSCRVSLHDQFENLDLPVREDARRLTFRVVASVSRGAPARFMAL